MVVVCSLCGCDQLDQLKGLTAEVILDKKQIIALQSEVSALKNRLSALEAESEKATSNEPQSPPPQNIALIKQTVSQCVQRVRNSVPNGANDFEARFYSNFDAFYNPATGQVQNNAMQ